MKSKVVLGLGNPLCGDDGIGWYVSERLASDSCVTDCVEIVNGGTDLLRHVDLISGREQVIPVDAILDDADPGSVSLFDDDIPLESHQPHAHHLSAIQTVRILKAISPSFVATRFAFVVVSVSVLHNASALSPRPAGKLPEIVDQVRHIIAVA